MSKKNESRNIRQLILNLLPAQIFVIATSSLASIVNGMLVGNNLPNGAMVAFGFVVPLTAMVGAVAQIISGGSGIVVGHHMGSGETEKINRTFTVSVITCIAIGILLTLISQIFPSQLAYIFGARNESIQETATYIRGLSYGFIGQILLASLMTYLNMCNKGKVSLLMTALMALFNLIFGLVSLNILNGNIFSVGIATSLSQLLTMVITFIYILKSKNLVRLEKGSFDKSVCLDILRLGAPGALASILYAIRNVFVNSASLSVGGNTAVNAMAILNSFIGVFDAFNIGVGTTVLMLVSLYVGEKDRHSIISLSKEAVKYGLVLAFMKVAILCAFGKELAVLFGGEGEVISEAWKLMRFYSYSMPINIFTIVLINTYQALGKTSYCSINYLVNCILIPLFCCYILGPSVGTTGIYIQYALAEVVSLGVAYVYVSVKNHHAAKTLNEILCLDEGFESVNSISLSITKIEEVSTVSIQIDEYLKSMNIDSRRCRMSALCAEEMTGNIVEHGFRKDDKNHVIDIFTAVVDEEIFLRIKDDCIPFDPHSKLQMVNPEDPCKNIGIRMVSKIAKEMNYQVNFGMNVLTIRL